MARRIACKTLFQVFMIDEKHNITYRGDMPHYKKSAAEAEIKKTSSYKWVQRGNYRFEIREIPNPYFRKEWDV